MEIEELTLTVRRFTRHISINRTHRGMVRVLNLIVILGVSLLWPRDAAVNAPPKAPRDNVKETIHGVEVVDPYRRSEEHTSELQSLAYLVCRLLLEKKKLSLQPSKLLLGDGASHFYF